MPKVIENLYSADFAYLQKMYNRINDIDRGPVTRAKAGARKTKR